MLRTILIIVGWIVLALILINVAMHLLGLFTALLLVLGLCALIGTPIFLYFKFGRGQKSQADARIQAITRIYEPDASARLFADEPTPTLLLTADTATLPTRFELANDTVIEIVSL